MKRALIIHPNDDVGVALEDLAAGESLQIADSDLTLMSAVRAKHKFSLRDLVAEEEIRMYGVVIGTAKDKIARGEVLTTFNVIHKAQSFTTDGKQTYAWEAPDISKFHKTTFEGFHRSDGQVGTGNHWLVFPMVFCENRNIETIKKAFEKGLGLERVDPYTDLVHRLVTTYEQNHDQLASEDFVLEMESVPTAPSQRVFEKY